MKKWYSVLSKLVAVLLMCSGLFLLQTNRVGAEENSDFYIEDTVLKGYYGAGGEIVIPEGVTVIGQGVFQKNTTITKVKLPTTLVTIGTDAFEGCKSLTTITIPKGVRYIGEGAFAGCRGLKTIKVSTGNKYYDSRNSCNAIIDTKSNVLLFGCRNTVIPEDVVEIGPKAFYECTKLTKIVFPAGLKTIGDNAFTSCSALEDVVFPEGLTTIGYNAFHGCKSMTKIVLPSGLRSLGVEAFRYCIGAKSIVIQNGLETISGMAFYCCEGATSVTIPKSVSAIGAQAFAGCIELVGITIPGNVKDISIRAFLHCPKLEWVVLEDGVTNVDSQAFEDCPALKSLSIPATVEKEKPLMLKNGTGLVVRGAVNTYAERMARELGILFIPFSDIPICSWQEEVAAYVYSRKLILGTTPTTFSPNAAMTREQLMILLWRMEGSPKMTDLSSFPDVSQKRVGAGAIAWAKSVGLAAGNADGTFRPSQKVTREQFVVFLYRYAKYKKADVKTTGTTYTKCSDAARVTKVFATQIEWAYERGLIAADGKLNPQGNITRIQAAAIFMRFLKYYKF